MIPAILNQAIRPTPQDAQYVRLSTDITYPGFSAALPYRETLEFCTLTQCNALLKLISVLVPENNLKVTDIGELRVYPPFSAFKYFNAGGPDDPRIYQIEGTIGDLQTIFEPGWLINVKHLIEKPGATKLKLVEQLGGIFPDWE